MNGRYSTSTPGLFEHDGTLWACYGSEPNENVFSDGLCTWTPRKLSEFYTALEAHEAATTPPVPADQAAAV